MQGNTNTTIEPTAEAADAMEGAVPEVPDGNQNPGDINGEAQVEAQALVQAEYDSDEDEFYEVPFGFGNGNLNGLVNGYANGPIPGHAIHVPEYNEDFPPIEYIELQQDVPIDWDVAPAQLWEFYWNFLHTDGGHHAPQGDY